MVCFSPPNQNHFSYLRLRRHLRRSDYAEERVELRSPLQPVELIETPNAAIVYSLKSNPLVDVICGHIIVVEQTYECDGKLIKRQGHHRLVRHVSSSEIG